MKKHIPNCITSMNLLCGLVGVVLAFKGRIDCSFYLMVAAAVFDFLDGLAARVLHAYSDMGKELDSLCDIVSFGVLPSFMLYSVSRSCIFGENIICWIPLLIAIFSGLRLAKFNVDERQTDSFLGLPTPACALLVGALCLFIAADPASFLAMWCSGYVFIPLFTACMCCLLICEIPMFSMKMHKEDSRALIVKRVALCLIVVASIAVCLIFKLHISLAVLVTFICYILKNIIYWIAKV